MRSKLVGLGMVAALIAGCGSPANKAEDHVQALIIGAKGTKPETTLAGFETIITGEEWASLGAATRSQVGAEVVRIAAELVPKPFTQNSVDEANRVVARYRGLPDDARAGAAHDTMLSTLEGWVKALPAKEDREARIALLRLELEVADGRDTLSIGTRLATERLEMAKAIEDAWPVDALGFLAEEPRDPQGVAEAGKILGRLIEQPALLVDAGKDVDAWLVSVPVRDPQRMAVEAQRELAHAAKVADDGETDPAKLKAWLEKRPWDQWIVVKLAAADLDADNMAAAEKRLRAIGGPGLMIREATFLYGRLASAQGQLETADSVMSGLLGSHLQRFLVASAKLDAVGKVVQERVMQQLEIGNLPANVLAQFENASGEAEKNAIVQQYFRDAIDADPGITAGRAAVTSYGDVVPASIALGMVKLRRAQALGGPTRDAMLSEAERAFLAVRTAAVGQPEYHLGLGEIYARLGKAKESDAEFADLLERKDQELSLRVAGTYRTIGNEARAIAVATDVFNTATETTVKQTAAALLGVMGRDDAERESWYRKSDTQSKQVRTSLLEIEARKLLREGKRAECDKKFAEAARITLAGTQPNDQVAQNNASLATLQRFQCTGDVARLREAETGIETAYRAASDQPIVIGNFASTLRSNADLRILAKRIDVTALRLDTSEAAALVRMLLDGTDRVPVLAELVKDPGWRRSGDLSVQLEVLMPASPFSYIDAIDRSERLLDPAAAEEVVARLRRTKAIDTSSTDDAIQRRISGADDKTEEPRLVGEIARDKEILSHQLEAKTRAAALVRSTDALLTYGVGWNRPEHVTAARAAYAEAAKLWPALTSGSAEIFVLVDEAGLAADGARWAKLRRGRGSAAILAQLVRDKDPLADKIRGASQWAEVVKLLHARTGRPSVDDLVLARLAADPGALTWANAVTADKVARAVIEARKLLAPKDPRGADQLAALAAN